MPQTGSTSSFPRKARLCKKAEFDQVFERGRRVGDSNLLILASRSKDTNATPRIGLVVSRKVGNSVVRNRVKRAIREEFRQLRGRGALPLWDIVALARPDAGKASREAVRESLAACLHKLMERAATHDGRTSPGKGPT
jgi:ribonuclease P protein component